MSTFNFNAMGFQVDDLIVASFDWEGERDQMVYLVRGVRPATRDGQEYTALMVETPFDATPKPWLVEAFLSRDSNPAVEIRQRDGDKNAMNAIADELGL
jgi:hypothetical protein